VKGMREWSKSGSADDWFELNVRAIHRWPVSHVAL
jgi:hypothetical protein